MSFMDDYTNDNTSLPHELRTIILGHVSARDRRTMAQVSTKWASLCNSDALLTRDLEQRANRAFFVLQSEMGQYYKEIFEMRSQQKIKKKIMKLVTVQQSTFSFDPNLQDEVDRFYTVLMTWCFKLLPLYHDHGVPVFLAGAPEKAKTALITAKLGQPRQALVDAFKKQFEARLGLRPPLPPPPPLVADD